MKSMAGYIKIVKRTFKPAYKKIISTYPFLLKMRTIYPIDIPDIEFLPNQDLILMDCPARNFNMMPNGLAYVHNALKQTGIRFQTIDLDNIIYHRYHMHRLLVARGKIYRSDGVEMPEDPWLTEHQAHWRTEPALVEYFQSDINEIATKLIDVAQSIDFIIQHKVYIDKITNINHLVLVPGSLYWLEPTAYNICFKGNQARLYQQHPEDMPNNLWYSEKPFIDETIRLQRFEKMAKAFYENGLPIGDYAEAMIKDKLKKSEVAI